jgi:peptidyl-prolyl cis-trans isomerase B (cyclophilin B)
MFEARGRKMSEQQKTVYKTLGGTPFLDGNYTVYGEVINGIEVIDKIAAVQTAPGDRPVSDVRMKMRIELVY